MPLDHRRSTIHQFPRNKKQRHGQTSKNFRNRGSNPGLVGESHLFCHYTISELVDRYIRALIKLSLYKARKGPLRELNP